MKVQIKFIQDKTGKLLFGCNTTTEKSLEEVISEIQKSNGGTAHEDCITGSTFQGKKDVFVDFEILN